MICTNIDHRPIIPYLTKLRYFVLEEYYLQPQHWKVKYLSRLLLQAIVDKVVSKKTKFRSEIIFSDSHQLFYRQPAIYYYLPVIARLSAVAESLTVKVVKF